MQVELAATSATSSTHGKQFGAPAESRPYQLNVPTAESPTAEPKKSALADLTPAAAADAEPESIFFWEPRIAWSDAKNLFVTESAYAKSIKLDWQRSVEASHSAAMQIAEASPVWSRCESRPAGLLMATCGATLRGEYVRCLAPRESAAPSLRYGQQAGGTRSPNVRY